MLLHHALWKAEELFSDNIAFDAPDGVFTFSEFVARVDALAGALQNLGVKKGDRVSILAPNYPDYIAYHYATATIGAILHVLNTRHVIDEMAYMINDAEASVLVSHERFGKFHSSLREKCPSLRMSIGIGKVSSAELKHDDLVVAGYKVNAHPDVDASDTALLIYTSGTTGRPKGACQTHGGSVYADNMAAEQYGAGEDDIYFAFMPYFHQAGLIRTRAILSRGGQSTMMEKPDPESVAYFLIEKGVSITMLMPPYDIRLIEIATQENLSLDRLRLVIGMGGLGAEHTQRLKKFCETAQCDYMGIYGQTEVTGAVLGLFAKDYFEHPTSCGRPLPGVDMEIWDEEGTALGIGETGEMVFRSPGCIPGYWRNQAASALLYQDGWLQTGDLAYRDEDGFAHFVDRKKELIKTGGENVYPAEVGAVVRKHPHVEDCAIFGVPDPKWGEAVAAAIVLKSGTSLSLQELRDYCRGKLGGYKIPNRMAVVEEIPRSFSGKIEKLQLKALLG